MTVLGVIAELMLITDNTDDRSVTSAAARLDNNITQRRAWVRVSPSRLGRDTFVLVGQSRWFVT